MPLSAAEKMRRYRERIHSDAERRDAYLVNERNRWKQRSISINDMHEKTQRTMQERWQRASCEYRSRKKAAINIVNVTPPTSPYPDDQHVDNRPPANRQRGRQKVRRDRAKVYSSNKRLTVKLNAMSKRADMYRKRLQRLKSRQSPTNTPKHNSVGTPKRNTNLLLRSSTVTKHVKKTLLFHNVLLTEVNSSLAEPMHRETEKQIASKLVAGNTLKKYRLVNFARKKGLLISRKRINNNQRRSRKFIYERKRQINVISNVIKTQVLQFFERDDNSRVSTNKKDTITRKSKKQAKRFLLETIKNLHSKFLAEHSTVKISYSVFCKVKPFWVVTPSVADRETCLCRKHDNLQLQADRLHSLRILQNKRVEDNIAYVVWDPKHYECMYRECTICLESKLEFCETDQDDNADIWWWSWETVKETYEQGGVEKTAQKTEKRNINGSVGQLKKLFESGLKKDLCPHVYNIRHQFQQYRLLKSSLAEEEAIVHIDFSENYGCKYASEIQSVHFGSSHKQATLHTCVIYTTKGVPSSYLDSSGTHTRAIEG